MEKKVVIELYDSQKEMLDIIALLDILHNDLKNSEELTGARQYQNAQLTNHITTKNHKWRVLAQISKEKLIEIHAQKEIIIAKLDDKI